MAFGPAAASPLVPDERFACPAGEDALRRAAAALTAKGFTVEILDDGRPRPSARAALRKRRRLHAGERDRARVRHRGRPERLRPLPGG